MLTKKDLLDADKCFTKDADKLYQFYFGGFEVNITDASAELAPSCLIECTKEVWASNSLYIPPSYPSRSKVTNQIMMLVMMRSKDNQGAKNTAKNLYENFSPYEDLHRYANLVHAPIDNTQIGTVSINDRISVVITTAVGPIALGETISGYEVQAGPYFLNVQIQKLKDAGLIPNH
jgi:hypothetical protein